MHDTPKRGQYRNARNFCQVVICVRRCRRNGNAARLSKDRRAFLRILFLWLGAIHGSQAASGGFSIQTRQIVAGVFHRQHHLIEGNHVAAIRK